MQLMHILAFLSVLVLISLWCGQFKKAWRKISVIISLVSIISGGVLLLLAVLPGNSFYGTTITSNANIGKKVSLTFDDGPYLPYTEELLAVLKEKQVQVTFFMLATSAEKNPELVKKIVASGHEIALHADTHKDFLKLSRQEQLENLVQGKASLEKISGQIIKYWRPPHGFRDWSVHNLAQDNKLTIVNWSVVPRDWTNPGTEVITERVLKQITPGAIVLLHDGDSPTYSASREQTVQATSIIIDKLRAQGYEFVTVDKLIEQGE